MEWTALGLKDSHDLTFVLLNPAGSAMEDFLKKNEINVVRIRHRGKYGMPLVLARLSLLFLIRRPDVVHAHLMDATLLGLTAAWLTGIRKRIYTRHNSTFHHVYFPGAVKYDRWSNRLATQIVSISQATDKALLEMENVSSGKVQRIPHGFELKAFWLVDEKRVDAVREKWKISGQGPRIGVIARHIEWKGVHHIIMGFKDFLKSYPQACLILCNAVGPFHEEIKTMLKDIPEANFILIPFEEDVPALYKLFDLYVHTPIDPYCEAFGQTYVEALASGIPSIFTLSGIAAEFVVHKRNAWVVNFKDPAGIHTAMVELWGNEHVRREFIERGLLDVTSRFDIRLMVSALKSLYEQ